MDPLIYLLSLSSLVHREEAEEELRAESAGQQKRESSLDRAAWNQSATAVAISEHSVHHVTAVPVPNTATQIWGSFHTVTQAITVHTQCDTPSSDYPSAISNYGKNVTHQYNANVRK